MDAVRSTMGLAAATLLAAQGVASIAIAPSASNSYSGTHGDLVNNGLFTAGLVSLAAYLARVAVTSRGRVGLLLVTAGALLLATSTAVTMAAGEERWDAAFIAGFAVAAVGCLAALAVTRAMVWGAVLLGLVLTLAFFDAAGGLALAAATAWSTRRDADLVVAGA